MININSKNCLKLLLGTGMVPCELKLKDFKSFLLVPKSWSLDVLTGTFDTDYLVSQIQNGTFVPFLNTVEFLNNTPETTTKEYQGGIMAAIRNGKPFYSFEFDNGPAWHGAAYSYNSFQAWNILIIDSAGTVVAMSSADKTKITGFPLSMLNTATDTPQVGDETAKTIIQFQISNEVAWNTRKALITIDVSGVDINTDVNGIISVIMEGVSSVAAGHTLEITANSNENYGIQAFEETNIRARNTVSNAVMPIESISETTPGLYTVIFSTPPVAGVKFVYETYDATATPPTATALISTNQLYRGVSDEITVVA